MQIAIIIYDGKLAEVIVYLNISMSFKVYFWLLAHFSCFTPGNLGDMVMPGKLSERGEVV